MFPKYFQLDTVSKFYKYVFISYKQQLPEGTAYPKSLY